MLQHGLEACHFQRLKRWDITEIPAASQTKACWDAQKKTAECNSSEYHTAWYTTNQNQQISASCNFSHDLQKFDISPYIIRSS